MRTLILLLLVISIAGCVELDSSGVRRRSCASSNDCPEGNSCEYGYCQMADVDERDSTVDGEASEAPAEDGVDAFGDGADATDGDELPFDGDDEVTETTAEDASDDRDVRDPSTQ